MAGQYTPIGQFLHEVYSPGSEYVPAVHVYLPVPSIFGQTVPAEHIVHFVSPAAEYQPEGHVPGVL